MRKQAVTDGTSGTSTTSYQDKPCAGVTDTHGMASERPRRGAPLPVVSAAWLPSPPLGPFDVLETRAARDDVHLARLSALGPTRTANSPI
jgi:hypothetical protein